MCQLAENLETGINLIARQRSQSLSPEALDRERSHHPAVEKGAFDNLAIKHFL
jgi:hypothetical protein